ncbi:OLC1v1001425C1 [Oldenlandia corymbosa var. corymbosa]|uniref:OLC1v1001425C1 n=1 Tax=Oldenlandia corymbosa var. corymbosa TaxID=529605 RepID=A0AAV1D597_OLDCO|nr:OLC1v1001425C1 [Oldenlandia corymbosa var. corymbosa]
MGKATPATTTAKSLLLRAYSLGKYTASKSIVEPKNDGIVEHEIKSDDHYGFGPVCPEAVDHQNPNPKLLRQIIIDRVFRGVSPYSDFPPPHVENLLQPSNIRGWGSTAAVFRNLIQKVRPKIIIEVGTFLGMSALHMVELTRELGLHDTQIICVDDFRGWPLLQEDREIRILNGDVMLLYQFMQNVIQANASESVIFLPSATGLGLDSFCQWGVYGDLIEVDAGHDFHSAWTDINLAYKILRPGGLLFGHDYFNQVDNRGVQRAVDLFAKIKNLRVETDGEHWILYDRSVEN